MNFDLIIHLSKNNKPQGFHLSTCPPRAGQQAVIRLTDSTSALTRHPARITCESHPRASSADFSSRVTTPATPKLSGCQKERRAAGRAVYTKRFYLRCFLRFVCRTCVRRVVDTNDLLVFVKPYDQLFLPRLPRGQLRRNLSLSASRFHRSTAGREIRHYLRRLQVPMSTSPTRS